MVVFFYFQTILLHKTHLCFVQEYTVKKRNEYTVKKKTMWQRYLQPCLSNY